MMVRLPRSVLAACVAIVAVIYCVDLEHTPVYLGGDESHFAVGAHAIATTGRALNGDLLPVFVNLADPLGRVEETWGDTWYHPLPFYVMAPIVKVLPFSIATVRLPSAIIGGVLLPLVIYLAAWRLTGFEGAALIAALTAALSPANVVMSRQALDYALPLPFVVGWFVLLDSYLRSRRITYLAAAGLVLGVGCYSYIASWALMPTYLLMTWIVLIRAKAGVRAVATCTFAFVIPLIAAPLWIAWHWDIVADTIARYSTHDVPKTGLLATYASVLDPVVLFVRGGPSMTTSTAKSGFVLLPAALFLVAGGFEVARRRDWMGAVIVAGVLTAPLPAAFQGQPGMIQRATYLLPFFALLVALGVAALWRSRAGRALAVAAIVAAPIQFGYFYFDYFTHYKLRSAFYYDPVAFRDVAGYLMDAPDTPAFYFTTDLHWAPSKWRFYTTVKGREALMTRTEYIAPDLHPTAAPGTLLVTYDAGPRIAALQSAGWVIEHRVLDVDSRPAAVILRKAR